MEEGKIVVMRLGRAVLRGEQSGAWSASPARRLTEEAGQSAQKPAAKEKKNRQKTFKLNLTISS